MRRVFTVSVSGHIQRVNSPHDLLVVKLDVYAYLDTFGARVESYNSRGWKPHFWSSESLGVAYLGNASTA